MHDLLMKSPFRRAIQFVLIFILTSLYTLATAHNKVVIVPLLGENESSRVIELTVAPQDADFSDPISALAAITDASAKKRYLISIASGVYILGSQLQMKEFVDIAGSGQDETILSGTISRDLLNHKAALALGASNATLRDLTLENIDGAAENSIGIYNDGRFNNEGSPKLSKVTIRVSGSVNQTGIFNIRNSRPELFDTQIRVEDGSGLIQIGVYNGNSFSEITNSSIFVARSGIQYGIYSFANATCKISSTLISVFGNSGSQYGIFNTANSFTDFSNGSLSVTGASPFKVGLSNSPGSFANISNSIISAETNSVAANDASGDAETNIDSSILNGEVTGDPVCSLVFLSDGRELDATCQQLQ